MRRLLALALIAFAAPLAVAEEPDPKQFRTDSLALLDDPTGNDAASLAKKVLKFVEESKDCEVGLGELEIEWMGTNKKYTAVLTAAYAAGNTQAQLNSGVIRNDRYAGLMYLFAAYRKIQSKDKEFKIDAVEKLLKAHKDDKLMASLEKGEEKKPEEKKKRKEN